MYVARPHESIEKRVREALTRPHDPLERVDPWFIVEMRCQACGKLARGPRCQISEGMREHLENDCPARHRGEPQVSRILFPRQ